MRREFIQTLAVLSLSLGAGLFAFGRHVDPPVDITNPALLQHSLNVDMDVRAPAAIACGVGVCLMTFGALCLILPWANDAIARRCQASREGHIEPNANVA